MGIFELHQTGEHVKGCERPADPVRIAMWVYNIEEEVDVNGKSVYGEKETLGEDLYHET